MPDFVTRLAQRGAGLRTGAAPQPAAAPWAAARLGGPADIVMEPEANAARRGEPPGPAAPRLSILEEGPRPSVPEATTERTVAAEAPRAPTPAVVLRDDSSALLTSPSLNALSQAPTHTAAPLSRDDPIPAPPAVTAKAVPAAALISRSEVQVNLPPGSPPANAAPQPASRESAAASASPRNPPAAFAAAARPVPVLALPQSTRPAAGGMPEATTPEQRPIQVRIGRVEVRAAQAAAAPRPGPERLSTQGFGAMQLARSWLGRSFY